MPSQFLLDHIPHLIIAAVAAFPAYKLTRWLCDKAGEWLWDSTIGEIQADRQVLHATGQNLNTIMTNHLPHLQDGINTLVAEQRQTNILLAEQSGYLKGILDKR